MENQEIPGEGEYALQIVGESHYQEALAAICGGKTEDGHEKEVEARLVFENDNRYDDHAVRVDIDGKAVGYLKREHARQVRKQIKRDDPPITCKAVIVGGWDRGHGDTGHFGVKLDIPYEP